MAQTLRARVVLAAACLAVLWFANLGYRDLFQTDEGRYAEVPREMLASGDWVTPRLDGLKYFEKPPLQYWATAATFALFGESNATSRLWTALTGFLGILMTGLAAARLFDRQSGWFASLALLASAYYVIMGHFNTLDMGVSFFMSASVFAFLLAMDAMTLGARRGWMYLAWGLAGLATLSKGLEAVVFPGAVFLIYVALTRDWSRFKQLHWYGGLPIYLALTAPWFLLVSLRNPEFPRFFFVHEHFERFLTTVHHRVEPWWFFLPILLFGLLPFLPQFLRGLAGVLRRGSLGDSRRRFNHALFLWLWCGFIFLFFSLSDSKLGSYILPMFPALAVLVGWSMSLLRRGDALLSTLLCATLATAALWIAPLSLKGSEKVPVEMYQAFLPWLAGGCLGLLLAALAGFLLAWFGRVGTALAVTALGMFLATQVLATGAQAFSPLYSQRPLATQIAGYVTPEVPFYSLDDYPQSLPFYLGRTLTIAHYKGELEFGIGQEPEKWIPDRDAFAAQWRADKAALAVMPLDSYAEMQKEGLPMTEIGRDPQRVVVRKP